MFGEKYGEVYSVRILDLGRKPSRKIHGEIVLKGLGNTYLFRRSKENPLTVSHDQEIIPLAGPIVATFGENWSAIIILKEGEDDLCRGYIEVCPPYYTGVKYDQPMTKNIEGTRVKNAAQITYASYMDAMDAILSELEIKLIENQNNIGKVSNSIIASVDNDKKLTSTIFNKNVDKSITLGPGQVIPLSRPLLSTPCSSYLLIKVDFWGSDHDSLTKRLVRGSLSFTPDYFGEDAGTLLGEYGKIEVKVTWFPSHDHQKSMALCPWRQPKKLQIKVDLNKLCPDMD